MNYAIIHFIVVIFVMNNIYFVYKLDSVNIYELILNMIVLVMASRELYLLSVRDYGYVRKIEENIK